MSGEKCAAAPNMQDEIFKAFESLGNDVLGLKQELSAFEHSLIGGDPTPTNEEREHPNDMLNKILFSIQKLHEDVNDSYSSVRRIRTKTGL
jgi:hypothetical protein